MNRNRPAGLVSIRTNIGCSASVSPHPELGSAPDAGEKGVVMNACPPALNSQSLIRWTVLAVCCLILGSRQGDRAAAQEPLLLPSPPAQSQPAAEVVTRDATPTFSSRVNLVPVSVVVRDDKGRAVGTLTKDDFRVTDNGKPQVVTKFSVERADTSVVV